MQYNPYDLLQLIINNKAAFGRPVAFDSDVVDQHEMKNAFGKYVKPTQVVSTCPDCGQGFTLNVRLSGPPFEPYVCLCPICKPPPAPILDPFVNPIASDRITLNELDPMLHNITKPIEIPSSTVQERLKKKSKPKKKEEPKEPQLPPQPQPIPTVSSGFIEHDTSKSKFRNLEPAEGMEGDEKDFDDQDLVEP